MIDANDIAILDKLFSDRIKGLTKHMNAEFNNFHSRFDDVTERLDKLESRLGGVEKQTTLTNGRVNQLEDYNEHHEHTRIVDCPQTDIINNLKKETDGKFIKLNEDLLEYTVIKKYPKIALGVIVITCISLFIGGALALREFNDKITTNIEHAIENTSNTNN
jgi:predicted nuclease with TOPRIM domain